MLLGEYEHTIDDKNRLTLPARFREAFAGGVVVTRGLEGCLSAYPREQWERLAAAWRQPPHPPGQVPRGLRRRSRRHPRPGGLSLRVPARAVGTARGVVARPAQPVQ